MEPSYKKPTVGSVKRLGSSPARHSNIMSPDFMLWEIKIWFASPTM
jgi:hypothetical protein